MQPATDSEAVGLPPGTVRLSSLVNVSPSTAWEALTEPRVTRLWFGELGEPLAPGVETRLDFGDGDFFDIRDVRTEPPERLEYSWRFLGTSPRDRISWCVQPLAGQGALVTVEDHQPGRNEAQLDEMREGWSDFLERFRLHLETGRETRYDWRREFDGAIELGVPADRAAAALLDPVALPRWAPLPALPWDGASGDSGQLRVELLSRHAHGLSLRVAADDWAVSTECRIAIMPRERRALLHVAHWGWEGVAARSDDCRARRARWAGLWIEALHRARRVTGRLPNGGN